MIDGAKVSIGGTEYVVPPVSCWAAKKIALAARDAREKETSEEGWIDVLWEQIRLALLANYPSLDLEDLQKAVPLRDLSDVHSLVMRASGASGKSSPGEAPSP